MYPPKIFYLEFFINEIFSVEKFPNYSILYLSSLVSQPHLLLLMYICILILYQMMIILSV